MASHGMLLRSASSHSSRTTLRQPKIPVVKLSRDAGRFLCEFILMTSLIEWYRAAQAPPSQPQPPSSHTKSNQWPIPAEAEAYAAANEPAREKIGKVAFLHVPNGIERADVERGVMVAESAIRALAASWEEGWRNPIVYKAHDVVEEPADKEDVPMPVPVPDGGFEEKGTGDRVD